MPVKTDIRNSHSIFMAWPWNSTTIKFHAVLGAPSSPWGSPFAGGTSMPLSTGWWVVSSGINTDIQSVFSKTITNDNVQTVTLDFAVRRMIGMIAVAIFIIVLIMAFHYNTSPQIKLKHNEQSKYHLLRSASSGCMWYGNPHSQMPFTRKSGWWSNCIWVSRQVMMLGIWNKWQRY